MAKARMAKLGKDSRSLAFEWKARIFDAQSIYFYRLLFATLMIVAFGLMMVLSASSIDSLVASNDPFSVFRRQAIWAIVGLIGLLAASIMPAGFFHKSGKFIFAGAMLLQLAVLATPLGISVNGNRAWLSLGPLGSLQPSEFIKIGLILVIAHTMFVRSEEIHDISRYAHPVFMISGASVGAILLGGDLGTVIIIVLFVLVMVWVSGVPSSHFRLPAAVMGLGLLVLIFTGSSRVGRISAWLQSGNDDSANPYAWQSVHGIWALAAGGFSGVGIGSSKMKWSWIPEVENDFIFAVIGEELGLVGALGLIAIFIFLIRTLYLIMNRCQDQFSKLVTLGVLSWIMIQAAVNIAVVLKLLPVLGVPLPLISAGGSSLISGMAAIGIVLSFERENARHLGTHALKRGETRVATKRKTVSR